ncbi:hypothetical protein QCA50_014987 [Cerrena zonata]|uniref:Uncharacterized protein n=1 Tax=Cerrena zonata TaxID=2478898 RepID=A0AAW0FWP4_9APHY
MIVAWNGIREWTALNDLTRDYATAAEMKSLDHANFDLESSSHSSGDRLSIFDTVIVQSCLWKKIWASSLSLTTKDTVILPTKSCREKLTRIPQALLEPLWVPEVTDFPLETVVGDSSSSCRDEHEWLRLMRHDLKVLQLRVS